MKRKLDWSLRSRDVGIVFEDSGLITLNKPANLLVIPDRYDKSLPSLFQILTNELGRIYVVHRLDKETSGVIVFAKTAEIHAELNRQFEEREVEKVYQAIVRGNPAGASGVIELPLSESDDGGMKVDKKRGKESTTAYAVVEQFAGYALLELRPGTGRTHQIRVHCQAIGLPILGDSVYGGGKPFFLSGIKTHYKSEGEEKPLLARTALHAVSLAMTHPATQEKIRWSAEPPKDMRSVLRALRKYGTQ